MASHFSLALAESESQNDPWRLLDKAAHAARDLSYKGIFIYQSGSNSRSIEITHMNAGQGEYSRVVMLDGLPQEVLSQGSDIVIFSPRDEKVVIEKRRGKNLFPALLPVNLDMVKASYEARVSGQERVAGREGVLVLLEPRDEYRYGYRLLTDKELGLLLKATTVNKQSEVIEQIAFNQAPASLADSPQSWSLGQLPPGYRQVDHIKRVVPGKKAMVNQLIFSDGLSSVSLFIEPLVKGARPKVGQTTVGPTNFYANVNGGHQVVVVGEVPQATVAEIANSVHFK